MSGDAGMSKARVSRGVLIAVGGNALIGEGQEGSIAEQAENARRTARDIAAVAASGADGGLRVVVTHGNGPQVGFILLRSELVGPGARVPSLSLDMCVADSQGGIGHLLSTALSNELAARGCPDRVAYLLTHTVVDPRDPAFERPSKPIGAHYDEVEAERRRRELGWTMVADAGRGYRRVVASPRPRRVVEAEQVRCLLDAGYVVVAAGGGGIPVVETEPGIYRGVEAVIDKDLASAELALALEIPRLVVSTGVEQVALDYGTPRQRFVDELTVAEARHHLVAGQFPPGSMGPKIEAAIAFLERGGREVIITSPTSLREALAGAGTRIIPARRGHGEEQEGMGAA
jgi:carbamate kinase